MPKNFNDLIQEFSPERKQKIEQRFQELKAEYDCFQSTQEILAKAFPDGIGDDLYLPLLTILEPELSDRNLASVIATVTGKEYPQVLNDIYKVKSEPFKDDILLAQTRSRLASAKASLLDACGYQQWLES